MYEHFTDRARKVMQLAEKEAMRFNHEYVGPEHILLGLIKEGSGVAAHVLMNLDLDVRKIRLEVEKIVACGPNNITMGRLPHTPRGKKVIEYAKEECKNLNHNYVGTEHLLLGLLREQEGVAAQVLMNLGLKLSDVREEVLNILGQNMEKKIHDVTVHLARPLMRPPLSEEIIVMEDSSSQGEAPPTTEQERICSLERQLWNVRVVLGALAGALAGALLAASIGAVLGLILGGGVAALGRRIPGALAGGIIGALLGSAHLPSEGGGLAGALLGALAGVLIAEIGNPSGRRREFANLWRRR